MAKIIAKPKLELELSFTVNESEARALDALVGYGDDAFIKAFYEKLGKCYMDNHEQGLRDFFTSIRKLVPPILSNFKEAKEAFK